MATISGAQFVDTDTAAQLLGLSPSQVRWLAQQGRLTHKREDGRFWVGKASVESEAQRRVDEAGRWVSYQAAAKIAGCNPGTIGAAVARGEITHREASRGPRGGRASLEAESVHAFAARWVRRKREAETRRAAAAERRPASAPPDDDQVWLSVETTALVLGLSPSRVKQLAAAGRLPHTRTESRAWFLREHVEQVAAARAFAHTQRRARTRNTP